MKHKKKNRIPAKYILLIMSVFCLVIIIGSFRNVIPSAQVNTAIGYVIIPMQKGINIVGSALTDLRGSFESREKLQQENQELRKELADARAELNQVQFDEKELSSLKELYEMDTMYSDYDKVAARIIGKDSGNWFSSFLIDKGSRDGITEGMNVIADGGLAGIVTEAGPNYASVRSVIDDTTNISCKDLTNDNLCIVSGSLKSMNESGLINFSDLTDKDNTTSPGNQIVTSNISDLYLGGIPVGYITEVNDDPNHLTKSGKIATIVDFEHMDKVFVILQTKASETENRGE